MPARRLGRPRLDPLDRSRPVSFSLPSKVFDRLCRRALRDNLSLAEVVRRVIRSRPDDSRE